MAENGYGPVAGHAGRIPNYGRTQVNPMGNVEPPACIQNAMMTKDKKPFTYTPGGLDLSQIKTPSMARRLARQRSQEERDQGYGSQHTAIDAHQTQGGVPPPPPPPQAPAPPPPPPIVIQTPASKSEKPIAPGERPEIVIPENPIGMLRKTNSPYHWESEKAQMEQMGQVPKFVDKVPSPLTLKMPPSSFSQQPPQTYIPQTQNSKHNYSNLPESPVHKPSPQYTHQKSSSPNINTSAPTRDFLQRQDSQFNKSPLPYTVQSPIVNNGSPFSPSPNRQPERRDSPAKNMSNSPQSPHYNRELFSPTSNNQQQYSPNVQISNSSNTAPNYHTLPRAAQRIQDNYVTNLPAQKQNNYNNAIYNTNSQVNQAQNPEQDNVNPTPWRTNTVNRNPRDNNDKNYADQNQYNQQQNYSPPWKSQEANYNQMQQNHNPQWKAAQENKTTRPQPVTQVQQYTPPWVTSQEIDNNQTQGNDSPQWRQDANNNRTGPISPPAKKNQIQDQPRYQSHISIPVTPRKTKPEAELNQQPAPPKEAVYVTQEPIYFCPDSPKSIPPWVKTQKEKTKTPPPEWCQKPLEGRRSAPRELCTPPRDSAAEPEWVRKSAEMQRNVREVISPPKYPQTPQPTWSTIPSENRKSLPRDNPPTTTRVIPVQMEDRRENQQPQLRIVIDMQNPNAHMQSNAPPYSQPTQRIMRVLSPQLVKLDEGNTQSDLPALNRNLQNNQPNYQPNQPKTRIIPIQLEDSSGSQTKSYGGRY